MKRTRLLLAALPMLLLLGAVPARSGAPGLDPAFGSGGIAVAPMFEGQPWDAVVQPDGKIVVVGCTHICGALGDDADFAVARFLPDGRLDESFGDGGQVVVAFGSVAAHAHAVALQPDGKIVVAGCTSCDWTRSTRFAAARLLADGSLDSSFSSDGRIEGLGSGAGTGVPRCPRLGSSAEIGVGLISDAYGVVVQSSGRIVLGGWAYDSTNLRTPYEFALAGYTPDGDPDCDFGEMLGTLEGEPGRRAGFVLADQGGADLGFALAIRPDEGLVLAGSSSPSWHPVLGPSSPPGDAVVAAFTASGRPDPGFGRGGTAGVTIGSSYRALQGVALRSDGGVIAAGERSGRAGDFAIVRFTPQGMPDAGFGSGSIVSHDFGFSSGTDNGSAVGIQSTGRIVTVGYATGLVEGSARSFVALTRHTQSGVLDTSFGDGGTALVLGSGRGMTIDAQDRLLVVGSSAQGPFSLLRFLPNAR